MKYPSIIVILVIFIITSCQDKTIKAELEDLKIKQELQEQNKIIVREVFDAIDNNDFEKLGGLIADNFSLITPGEKLPWQKEDLFEAITTWYTSFPDWKHHFEDIVAEGDKVMVKVMMNGTHKAEYMGISATNKILTMPAASLMTIVDGQVKEWWAIEDHLGFHKQLGMDLKMKEESE